MKIAFIHNAYAEPGGEDTVVRSEVASLRARGHEVRLYEVSNADIDAWPLARKAAFLFTGILGSRSVYASVRDFVDAAAPDLGHVHNVFFRLGPVVYAALRDAGVPVVQTLHNYRLRCANGLFLRAQRPCEQCRGGAWWPCLRYGCWRNSRVLTFFLQRAARKHWRRGAWTSPVDRFIAPTVFARRQFEAMGVPADRIRVIPHGVNVPEGEAADAGYGLFVGRLVGYKGIDTVLAAFGRLPGRRLKIVGDGPLSQAVERAARGMPNVERLGRLPPAETLALMRSASCVICASVAYETFGQIVVEAFGCGVPVVASDAGAPAEIVRDGGGGLLFASGDAEDLAAKVEQVMSDAALRSRLVARGREAYRRRYTVAAHYGNLMALYADVLREHARGVCPWKTG